MRAPGLDKLNLSADQAAKAQAVWERFEADFERLAACRAGDTFDAVAAEVAPVWSATAAEFSR